MIRPVEKHKPVPSNGTACPTKRDTAHAGNGLACPVKRDTTRRYTIGVAVGDVAATSRSHQRVGAGVAGSGARGRRRRIGLVPMRQSAKGAGDGGLVRNFRPDREGGV